MTLQIKKAASTDHDRISGRILDFCKKLTFAKISFNIIFHGLHLAIFIIGWWSQQTNHRLAALNDLTFSVWLSRGAGLVLTVDTTIIILPMCRNIMSWTRPKMRWLPLDETQFFHRQCAYSLLFWTCIHVLAHYVNFYNVEKNQVRPEAAVQIHYEQAGGITGHVMLLCMFLMFTTSHFKIRQQSYETFWYTHHLFVPFLLAMYTHATGCFVRDSTNAYSPFDYTQFWDHCLGYEGWRWEIAAGALYLAERITREVRARRETRIVKVIKHPYDAIEIQFTKPSFKYNAGQWLFLNVPSVSKHQWHPFTITSCPFDPYVSVHVRQVGDFTRDLASALGATTDDPRNKVAYENVPEGMIAEILPEDGQMMPELRIDGPYGAPAEDVFENEVAVLIGTGIGVTPWASILKNIWHLRNDPNANRRLKRVEFIWVSRDTESFEWFKELLASLEFQSEQEAIQAGLANDGGFIRIHTYLTQRINVDMAHNIVLNSVGQTKDPLTELKAGTNFGRPDFPKFMGALRDGIINQQYGCDVLNRRSATDVGVYFCGPNVAARDIKKACSMASVPQVRFKFWKEHF